MMKKFSLILMVFAVFGLVSLSSCSGSANKEKQAPATEQNEQEITPAEEEAPADTVASEQNEMDQDSTNTDME